MERITNTTMAKRKVKSFLHLRRYFGDFVAKCSVLLNSKDELGLVFSGREDFTVLGHPYRLAFSVQDCNGVMRGHIDVLRVEQDGQGGTYSVGELHFDDLGNFALDQDGYASRYHVTDEYFYKETMSVYFLNHFFQSCG